MSTRALLASPLGFVIGVSLGAFGGGGSILAVPVLAVPVLVFVAGQKPSAAHDDVAGRRRGGIAHRRPRPLAGGQGPRRPGPDVTGASAGFAIY